MGPAAQSVHDKHSINVSKKKLKELGLYKPVAKWQWEEKKEMCERLQPILAQRFVPKAEAEKEAKVPPAILAQRKTDYGHALRAFEEAKEKFNYEFNLKKKQQKGKKAKSKDVPVTPTSEAPAKTTKPEKNV